MIPNVKFYQTLHSFSKKWPVTRTASKMAIGKLYLTIDKNLKEKGIRADYAYILIEHLKSKHLEEEPMTYGISRDKKIAEKLSLDISHLNGEVSDLKQQLESSRNELQSTNQALRDITNEINTLQKKSSITEKKVTKLQKLQPALQEEIGKLLEENIELSETMEEESHLPNNEGTCTDIQTMSGLQYLPSIRMLYYELLANQVPANKIPDTIKAVVKCFNPLVDIEQLRLPQRSCAGYMRKCELQVVSNAHKTTMLCESLNSDCLRLNTDGTTKSQRKLGGVALNDIVISVNEIHKGSADCVVADISGELEKLRTAAQTLGLPNANSINWTVIVSSSSDSAATQKRLNKLVEECRQADQEKFGPPKVEAFDLIENFCAMHLGINLRKAFLNGLITSEDRHHPVGKLVHEFCKLFGKHGVKEYGLGVSFSDFLLVMSTDSTLNVESRSYYQHCGNVTLDRQVGNRYFVTASNAAKIFFLKSAALDFLQYTDKHHNGNKLEKAVFEKLVDHTEVAYLKVDALIFYHIYADLVMLSKSNVLNKSVLDMKNHYFELKLYLNEVKQCPEVVMQKEYHVFKSEERLYGLDKRVNHRLHESSKVVYEQLFNDNYIDNKILYQLIVSGVAKMNEKLSSYAVNQLPGGKFWNPTPFIRKELSKLKPSNDIVESMLGLNDYLITAIPNLNQVSRSNLIQVKKNKTVKWLKDLPTDTQCKVVDLATSSRKEVERECRLNEQQLVKERVKNMVEIHNRQLTLKRKAQVEKDKLSQMHLITTCEELLEALADIESQEITCTKKRAQKLQLLKNQVKIMKKVLGKNVSIVFSHKGKQRPLDDLIQEVCDIINEHSIEYAELPQSPYNLIGKSICHKFVIEDTQEIQWFFGEIIGYDPVTKTHEIMYEDEDDHCFFDITVDLLNGDLKLCD